MTNVVVSTAGPVGEDEPLLFSDDLGLTRGDGCFDATRVTMKDARAHADHLNKHLERFGESAAAMEIDLDRERLITLIDEALDQWNGPEATLKMIVTRGREFAEASPTLFVTICPFPQSQIALRSGIRLTSLSRGTSSTSFADAPWLLGGVKYVSYAVNMAAKREASRRGADDALFMTTDGYALEGPNAALLWLSGGVLHTTTRKGTGILRSITQEACFDGAISEGVETRYDLVSYEDLLVADSAWLASSTRGIAPIISIDDSRLSHDIEWTNRLNTWAGFPRLDPHPKPFSCWG